MTRRDSRIRAFTLIELMVVIAIIGLLTAIITANFSTDRAKARDAKRVSDVGQIGLAIELYFDRCRQYPVSPLVTSAANGCPTGITLATYISVIPTDPLTSVAYGYVVNNSGVPTDYILHTTLEGTSDSLKDSLSNTAETAWFAGYSLGTPPFNCYDASSHPLDYCLGSH